MNSYVKAIDGLPLWLKIIFCLPVLNLVYALYRIFKGATKKDTVMTIVGVLWIFIGSTILWLVDLVCTILNGKPTLFA